MEDTHNKGGTYQSSEQTRQARIEWHKKYIQDLVQMKKEEQQKAQNNRDEQFSSGRRRWFNQEIQKSRNILEDNDVKVNL